MIKRAREEEQINAIADKWSAPTYTSDIAEMLPCAWSRRALAPDGPGAGHLQGVLHFSNSGQCSWQEYAQHAIDCCHKLNIPLKAKTVGALKLADMKNWVARRPVYSVLSNSKYTQLTGTAPRSWRDAVSDYIERSYSKK
jgi:dTDP-4-dehydrorhamnose reductase